jgi:hypothetical protein
LDAWKRQTAVIFHCGSNTARDYYQVAHRFAPPYDDFTVARIDEERPDLMDFRVVLDQGQPRFKILEQGSNVRKSFGVFGKGRFLDAALGSAFTELSQMLYRECVYRGKPAYSISNVQDRAGTPVDYERLLLPFCDGARIDRMLASLKPISIDGAFELPGLMAQNQTSRKCVVYAIIDQI